MKNNVFDPTSVADHIANIIDSMDRKIEENKSESQNLCDLLSDIRGLKPQEKDSFLDEMKRCVSDGSLLEIDFEHVLELTNVYMDGTSDNVEKLFDPRIVGHQREKNLDENKNIVLGLLNQKIESLNERISSLSSSYCGRIIANRNQQDRNTPPFGTL